jgi:protein-tyrosine phosphatase
MVQITERIFISSAGIVPVPGVTGCLNVALDLDRQGFGGEYNKVGLIDGPGNFHGTLTAAVQVLFQMLGRNDRVVVCCHMGLSRSVIVVALFMAANTQGMTIEQAINLVKTKHPHAEPNKALVDLATICLQRIRK